jgi:hypothetical protein
LLFVGNRELHEVGLDESVKLAVHDGIDIMGLEVRAVVLDTFVVEDV